jgi:hypothetical protein
VPGRGTNYPLGFPEGLDGGMVQAMRYCRISSLNLDDTEERTGS